MNTIEELEQLIVKWGVDRNILGPTGEGTREKQWHKTAEEVDELHDAIMTDDITAARDAIGDIIVTLIMQASLWNLSLHECLLAAYNEIKDRKGRMQNGIFVKES